MCFLHLFFRNLFLSRNLSPECRITKKNHKRGFFSCIVRVLNFQNTKLHQNERSDIHQKLVFYISRSTDVYIVYLPLIFIKISDIYSYNYIYIQ